MPRAAEYLHDPDSLWPNILAFSYILLAYGGGWWALFQGNGALFALGVVGLAHAMVIAAYLLHDCGHNTIFRKTRHNARLGRFLNMLTGTNYGTFEDIRYKHMRHHVDNCEPVAFDYRSWLQRHPRIKRAVSILEWFYIPAVELIMHTMLILAPFVFEAKRHQRARVIRVTLIRAGLFGLIAWFAPAAALGYMVAYLLFLTVMRLFDAFQHNYEIYYTLDTPDVVPPHRGNREYEERNTYSNLISRRWPWLNLLALNFPYHNAHHTKPIVSWHRLPAFHREIYGDGDCPQQFSLWPQLVSFHRHRVARVLAEEYGTADVRDSVNQGRAVGVNALSFLTAF